MEDWLGATQIVNDALGRAERVTYPDGKEVGYTYGKAGERRSLTYPDGRTVSYGYDEEIRLSELKEGDAVIRYGYDPAGRLLEKVFLNGTRTAYTYDRKSRVTGLTHMDGEGIIDQYVYEYDPAGNKTGIRKERRGLGEESGQYAYVYDALGRLTEARKDGRLLRRYGYDAFGNRTELAEGGKRTEYAYNALNQLVAKRDSQGETLYEYDRRGNLTELMENGALKNRYAYGALNRLERAEGVGGIAAEYQYNGLGHRTGKEVKDGLNPESRIRYVIDLTREYHNLLQKEEGKNCQTYLWDGNVAGMSEHSPGIEMASSGKLCRKYYLQDELGSPLRLSGADGNLGEAYGYDEFGRDLYGNQGEAQAFGYTGYQYDNVSGTYFAQAREYEPQIGRFRSVDLIEGIPMYPLSLNKYIYCWDNPEIYVDNNGELPAIVIGAGIGAVVGGVGSIISDVSKGKEIDWKKAGKNALKVGATGAIVGSGIGIAASMTAVGNAGAGAATFVGVSASAGAITGGVSAKITGGNVVNNMCGGAVNGTVTAVGTVMGAPGKGNALGGAVGSLTVDILEREGNIPRMLGKAAISGGVQSGMSMGGAVTKAGYDVDLKNLSAAGIFLNYVNMVYSVGGGVTAYGFQKTLEPCPE